jgi:hypothetical protein
MTAIDKSNPWWETLRRTMGREPTEAEMERFCLNFSRAWGEEPKPADITFYRGNDGTIMTEDEYWSQ